MTPRLPAFILVPIAITTLLAGGCSGGRHASGGAAAGSSGAALPFGQAARPGSAPAAQLVRSAAGMIDACVLVTREKAEAAAGQSLPQQTRDDGGAKCAYESPDSGFNVDVSVNRQLSSGAAREDFDLDRKVNGKTARDVSGIGDAAFYTPWLGTITVVSGNTSLSVQVARPDLPEEALRSTLEGLARKAVQRRKGG